MNTETEDSASITIEFLRARLHSERSVSTSARLRADDLAKRVLELEDQLMFISRQRSRAEKATSHLLAILENNGLQYDDQDDLDDLDYSTSDQDDSTSVHSKPSTTLSWKTTRDRDRDTRRSTQKKHFNSTTTTTRLNTFSSSPKRPSGKSCRQIGRRETRLITTEELRNDDSLLRPQTNLHGIANSSNCEPQVSGQGSPLLEEDVPNSLRPGNDARDKGMERALLQQAQLIGRYQEEEKAQRDWEDKFKETNSSSPDTNEPGNQSDITEEIYDIKTGTAAPSASENQDAVSGAVEVGFHPPAFAGTRSTGDQMGSSELEYGSLPSAESKAKEKQTQKQLQNYSQYASSHDHVRIGTQESLINQSAASLSSAHEGSRGETSKNRNERYAIVPHKPAVEIGGVLEALQAAKSSIQQRLARLPLLEGGSSRVEIPVGCAGLFRVPSDTHFEVTTKKNFLDPNAQLSRTTTYPDKGSVQTTGDGLNSIPSRPPPYMETRSSVFSNGGFMPNPYRETGSRNYSRKPYSNPYNDLSSVPHNYPSYPSFPDFKGGMASSTEGIIRSSAPSRVNVMMSSPEHFSFYNDGGVRPNVYR